MTRTSLRIAVSVLRSLLCALLLPGFPLAATAQYRPEPRFRAVDAPPRPTPSSVRLRIDTSLVVLSDSALGIASLRQHAEYGVLVGCVAAMLLSANAARDTDGLMGALTLALATPPAALVGAIGGAAVHDIRVARARRNAARSQRQPSTPASPQATPEDPDNAAR